MNDSVFREYDIRGVVNKDFSDVFVFNLGKALGSYLINNKEYNISVSGDIRYSTEKLKIKLIEGLLFVGVNVCDIGILPTPINYFSLFNTKIPNSIQITGSHNPPEYNGFKISFKQKPFYGAMIQEIKDIILEKNYVISKNEGKLSKLNILNDYTNYIKKNIEIHEKFNVVLDCANAAGCLVAPKLFIDLGINVEKLYCNINPSFPNHHPDPTVDENLDDLINIVKIKKNYIGIAFDGDADRIIVVDEKGRIIRADVLLAFFVKHLVKKGDSVVYDVKCSSSVKDVILESGGKSVMWKTGHSLIKNKMIQTNAKIGGEMSGHIFFSDRYFGYDDAVYVALRLLEVLSKTKQRLYKLIDEIPKYDSTPEIRIDCQNDNDKFKIVDDLIKYYQSNYDCETIDGVRINYDNGWGLIRASNTQPVIVCRFEADSKSSLNKIKNDIINKIKEISIQKDLILHV